ncbi:unnamed protein product [Dracunculus medinensis]|uniref:WW domain-containing protein n=1 Tax=Dracunculus medinensis TaxID=318479 RepID=A0A0N4UH01_DRAME|nr:unnamed protein product [Dracunculus medinensis]
MGCLAGLRKDRQSTASSSTRLKEFGPWTEQYSSSGRRYFYNRETEVSQWEKPPEWREYEKNITENRPSHSPISSLSGVRGGPCTVSQNIPQRVTTGHNPIADDESLKRSKAQIREPPQTTLALPIKRAKTEIKEEDIIPPTVFSDEQHRRFFRHDLVNQIGQWPADDLEQVAWKADAAAHNLSLQIIYVSCDLKSASSLVKTAQMRSSLLARKLLFISEHQRQLEASFALPSMPSASF